jgi:hypothetical protein
MPNSDAGNLAWGSHVCQFYRTPADLTDVLIPYFSAGLAGGHSCTWITSHPLTADDAKAALGAAVSDLQRYLATGQLAILSHDAWYVKEGTFDAGRVIDIWADALTSALARGYSGIRAAGNMSWLGPSQWRDFMAYERTIDGMIAKEPLTAICSYPLDACGAAEVQEVSGIHPTCLVKRRGAWEFVKNAALPPSRGALEAKDTHGAARQAIFTSTVEAVSGSFRVLISTDRRSEDYTADIRRESPKAMSSLPLPAGPVRATFRARTLAGVIAQCEEAIRAQAGAILNRGGLPRAEDTEDA